jgi:threonine synthase
MDIQVASNFERFLYFAEHSNPGKVREIMEAFKEKGSYEFSNLDTKSFSSSRTNDTEIRRVIALVHQKFGYVADPHTACGLTRVDSGIPQVVLATAHPAKFPETILECTGTEPTHSSLEKLKSRNVVKHKVASEADAVKTFIRQHI